MAERRMFPDASPSAPGHGVPAISEGKDFGRRALSYVIDLVIIQASFTVANVLVWMAFGLGYWLMKGHTPTFSEGRIFKSSFALWFGLTGTYFALFEWLFGATPGKLLLGMRVVKEDGSPCTLGAAVLRALAQYYDGLMLGLVALGSMSNTPLSQRYGDKFAHTVVVGVKAPSIRSRRPWFMFLVSAGIYLTLLGGVSLAEFLLMVMPF
jgi:uncharacterized RDD family membrane protein YckC